jgi:hypothetical protein
MQGTPPNKAFKLTRSIGLRRMEALRATMRRVLRPSQLNAMLDLTIPLQEGEVAEGRVAGKRSRRENTAWLTAP